MRNTDEGRRAEVNEFLDAPLGVHPEQTAAAKKRRRQQVLAMATRARGG
jgi:hypothetical protein